MVYEKDLKATETNGTQNFPTEKGPVPFYHPVKQAVPASQHQLEPPMKCSPRAGAIRAREKMPRLWERNQRLDKASWIRQALEREAKSMSQKPEADTKIHLPKKITTSPCHYLGERHKIVGQVLRKAASSKTKR